MHFVTLFKNTWKCKMYGTILLVKSTLVRKLIVSKFIVLDLIYSQSSVYYVVLYLYLHISISCFDL
jgi:hypothetical protein